MTYRQKRCRLSSAAEHYSFYGAVCGWRHYGTAVLICVCPDMRLPIQYALYYPERRPLNTGRVDFFELGKITFEKPDFENFRGLKLAYEAASQGGNIPTAFNAANEVAVRKFLNREIAYLDIPEMIAYAMEQTAFKENPDVAQILETERAVTELLESRW